MHGMYSNTIYGPAVIFTLLTVRDVRNRFFILVRFRFGLKKNSVSVRNEFGWFGSKKCGSDIIVIYYSG